jgi:pimeloyl-ACP methyl ester carboxylesterase
LTQKKRGSWRLVRNWTIWIISVCLLSVLFIQGVFVLLDGFNIWVLSGLALLLYIFMALLHARNNTNPKRFPIFYTDPKDLGFKYQDVTFASRDGLELSGWFVPGRNGATVILTHGFSGNRLSGLKAARMLIGHGYSLLLYDLRSHGRSQEEVSTWGWAEINDLLGAVDYLRSRPDVDAGRIGALGYSLGGQVTLRAAAQDSWIRAVAVEGSPLAVLEDHIITPGFNLRKLVFYPWLWLSYQIQVLLTGVRMPEGVVAAAARITPRPLVVVTAGRGQEYLIGRVIFEKAGEPKEFYNIAEAAHGECLRARPEEYEQKLVGFFERALAVDGR